MADNNNKITTSSTAEYFSKNLQQVGFSSNIKAVLTILKEAVDNALDACEEKGILPVIKILINKVGPGSVKNSDKIFIRVDDNGPGIAPDDIPKVFGEYLASSKFGRGRCSRGQQGIGISAATTWAQLTNASGVKVITKTKNSKKAISCIVEVDIKNNKGIVKDKELIDWDREHGTSVEFTFDGKIQLNGEAGILNYINGTTLVNPHLTLHYKVPDYTPQIVKNVSGEIPKIPDTVDPHPHTLKLGEFITYSHMLGKMKTSEWMKKAFSRVTDGVVDSIVKAGFKRSILNKSVDELDETEIKTLFEAVQNTTLQDPSTRSVMSVGEQSLSKSIKRLGDVDFFSVISRRPVICDFKPVLVEVAMARLRGKSHAADDQVQVLRFANRVPLQFDKSSCAIAHAVETVNWRAYGLDQPKNSLPLGPYILAVSIISPFIKFKNASKETIDASEELVEEIRLALIQAGQKLSKYIKHEQKSQELENRIKHIEQFCPILISGICRITHAPASRKKKAEEGLLKILGRDANDTKSELKKAETILQKTKDDNEEEDGRTSPTNSKHRPLF